MKLSDSDRLEILKIEMQLIQGTLDKYDQLIYQNRSWFVAIWTAAVAAAFTEKMVPLTWLAGAAAFAYWLFEGLQRQQSWYKYVLRYRTVRAWLNEPNQPDELKVYDLSNHYGQRDGAWFRFRKCFFKLEPMLVYGVMAAASMVAARLVPGS